MKITQSKTEVNINHNSCSIFKTDVTKVRYTPRMKNPSLLANFINPFAFIVYEVMHRTVMSLEPYCLAICYQSSKTKRFKARQYGLEEITDIIFRRITRNWNIYRPQGMLDEESAKVQ